MRTEVMEYYPLTRALRGAGYYETAHHRQLLRDVKRGLRRLSGGADGCGRRGQNHDAPASA